MYNLNLNHVPMDNMGDVWGIIYNNDSSPRGNCCSPVGLGARKAGRWALLIFLLIATGREIYGPSSCVEGGSKSCGSSLGLYWRRAIGYDNKPKSAVEKMQERSGMGMGLGIGMGMDRSKLNNQTDLVRVGHQPMGYDESAGISIQMFV